MFQDTYQIALLVIASLLAALVGFAIWTWRKTNYTLGQSVLYLVNRFFVRCMWRTKISGKLPITSEQGAVIVANHYSGVDPLLIQITTDRVVHWMVATEYYHKPVMRQVFQTLGAIPVNRGGVDTASTKQAIRIVQGGGLVGLFPEGRINETHETNEFLLPGRPGAALIALKARATVIPIFIEGSPYNGWVLGSFFMMARARVTVGQPIDLSEYFGREKEEGLLGELTKRFLTEIAKLAGKTDFEPKLAGRRWKAGEEDEPINEYPKSDDPKNDAPKIIEPLT